MKTSVRRHSLRLIRGVNKKFESTRWIGQWTVRVLVSAGQSVADRAYVKAGKGVEKSLRVRRRRKRGQRRGKCRSRGGKPRSTRAPAALYSKEPAQRVNVHGERLFAIMRRSSEKLLSRVERSLEKSGSIPEIFQDEGVRRHISGIWHSHARLFPPSHAATFFGKTSDEFIRRLEALAEEDRPPPPPRLPPRPGAPKIPYRVRPPRSPPMPPERLSDQLMLREALVPNVTLDTHRKKDSYGPNPCPWCREDWASIGEVGACLEIQGCVRAPENLRRRQEEGGWVPAQRGSTRRPASSDSTPVRGRGKGRRAPH